MTKVYPKKHVYMMKSFQEKERVSQFREDWSSAVRPSESLAVPPARPGRPSVSDVLNEKTFQVSRLEQAQSVGTNLSSEIR